jgi:hypothetical protein
LIRDLAGPSRSCQTPGLQTNETDPSDTTYPDQEMLLAMTTSGWIASPSPPPKTALLERVFSRTTSTPAFFLFKRHFRNQNLIRIKHTPRGIIHEFCCLLNRLLPTLFASMLRRLLLQGRYRVRRKMFVPLHKVGFASHIRHGNWFLVEWHEV